MDLQNADSVQRSQNIRMIIIGVVATALIVGIGVYLWQRSNLKSAEQASQKQINELQNKINLLQQDKAEIINLDSESLLQGLLHQDKLETIETDSERSPLQDLNLSPVCMFISDRIGSDEYDRKRNLFISKYRNYFKEFENQLVELAEKEDMALHSLCEAGTNYAFLGHSRRKDDIILGGFSSDKKQINIKRLPIVGTYHIEGFIGDFYNELILGSSEGYAENSCHVLKEFIFDIESSKFKKIRDCEGCDEIADGRPYKCSLDIFNL